MRAKIAWLALVPFLAACASGDLEEGELVADPYENFNRGVHSFNKGLDRAVINPVSTVYGFATPELGKLLIGNGLSHLSLPVLFANHLLQGDFNDAGATLARFTLNTVMGAGGLLDPATAFGANYRDTDFGVTLAEWGVGPGVYFELPLLGPSTTRDAVGTVADIALNPTTWVGGSEVATAKWVARGVELADTRDRYRAFIDEVLYESEDSYRASRNAYIQNRRRLVAGETPVEELPDIFPDATIAE